jgi:hypothetical protein
MAKNKKSATTYEVKKPSGPYSIFEQLNQKQKDDRFISEAVGAPAGVKIVISEKIVPLAIFSGNKEGPDRRPTSKIVRKRKEVPTYTAQQLKKIKSMRESFADDRSNRAR